MRIGRSRIDKLVDFATARVQFGDALQQPLRIGGRAQQMERLLHSGPFACRDQHNILAALARDHHGGSVRHDLVEHGLQVLARFGIGDGLHETKMDRILSNAN